uniref:N-acetylglucosaminylphosphatidylinositol deacetylase n=1 Tax=Caenorhabditis tropicalis TaxID=1561998 RepID=A0A1I7TF40_9PELO
MLPLILLIITFLFVLLLLFAVRSHPLPLLPQSRILILIAHPDDETMFFSPTIRALSLAGHRIFILCISNGNFDGLGKIRARELSKAALQLGISPGDVTCLDYDEFHDGATWNRNALCHVVMRHVEVLSADTVISFDAHGVSGHLNHSACFDALQTAYTNGDVPRDVQIFVLDSIPLWRKYIGMLDAVFSFGRSPFFYMARFRDVAACWRAMWAHRTQLVWFRVLFIFFSRYVYMNSLRRISPLPLTPSPRNPQKFKFH